MRIVAPGKNCASYCLLQFCNLTSYFYFRPCLIFNLFFSLTLSLSLSLSHRLSLSLSLSLSFFLSFFHPLSLFVILFVYMGTDRSRAILTSACRLQLTPVHVFSRLDSSLWESIWPHVYVYMYLGSCVGLLRLYSSCVIAAHCGFFLLDSYL